MNAEKNSQCSQPAFLPMSRAECDALGWHELDVIIVTGDAYVDHPSFGAALIGRTLVAHGFTVGIIAQPRWDIDEDFLRLGRPRLFFGVTAGNMDSMVNHYTAQRKIRTDDAYSPEGKAGHRPDRATLVYTQHVRRLFKGVPVVIGGIEASMRRIPHYDYWSDKVRNSILLDAKADVLMYGMAEKTVVSLAQHLHRGARLADLQNLPGTVVPVKEPDCDSFTMLPAWEQSQTPEGFWHMSRAFHTHYRTTVLIQHAGTRYLKHNLPAAPMTTEDLDAVYALPFSRRPHPEYNGHEIPAHTQIKDSVTAHRGCFGGCHFCALGYHQGKTIQSRSVPSVVTEITSMAHMPGFTGTISDIGGPSANMYGMTCRQGTSETCARTSCLAPDICPHLARSHEPSRRLLAACRKTPGIKNAFVASGIRFDLALGDDDYMHDIALYHTGGRLKIAPEHISTPVLALMNKPGTAVFETFCDRFFQHRTSAGKACQIVPYLMVGHPGTTMRDAIALAQYLNRRGWRVEQVQEFTPTPMTASTCMYYSGRTFDSGVPLHVPKGREVRLQKALVQWFMPDNRKYVIEALKGEGMLQKAAELLDTRQHAVPHGRHIMKRGSLP